MSDIIDGKLPKSHTTTLYVLLNVSGYRGGEIKIYDCDITSVSDDYILIDKVEHTFKIPENINLKGEIIKSLESEKANIKAKFHMKIKEVQDKIDNLLAIEYQGETS